MSSQKLTGPVVVGRMVLPVEREKSDNNSRKKRKRIKKVNIDKQVVKPASTDQQGQGTSKIDQLVNKGKAKIKQKEKINLLKG